MKLIVNGEPRQTTGQATVLSYAREELGLDPRSILVEWNGQVLPRDQWAEQFLSDGDRLEILRIVAGG